MTDVEGQGPARGYTWPPFAPGHEQSIKHGATSERRWRPIAQLVAVELVDSAPWLAGRQFAGAVAQLARVEAQLELLGAWLDEHGLLDDEGVPWPATGLQQKLEARAQSLRGDLGLQPVALVRVLAGLSAIDGPAAQEGLEALKAAGRGLRVAAEQRAVPSPSADPLDDEAGDDGGQQVDGVPQELHEPSVRANYDSAKGES